MTSKSTVSDVLQELIYELSTGCRRDAKDRVKNKAVKWLMPPLEDWDGNLYNWSSMYSAFSSDAPNEEFIKTVDPKDPGNHGDIMMCITQIDYLSVMERAFRARHTMTFPRNVAHHCSRKDGEGNEKGPLRYGVLDYLKELKKVSAGS